MTREEAEEYAKDMTYRDAVHNTLQGKCIPYRKATLIKLYKLLDKLEQEPCEYAPFTIDELEDEDTQKLFRKFKNQRVIVADNDCSPSVTIIEPCDVPDINVGDMISREAVLDIVRFENKWLFDSRSNNRDTDIAFNGIISKVSDLLPVTPKAMWIPCNERLPEENEYVGDVCKYYLIQDEYGDMHVAHLSKVGWIPMDSLKAIGNEIVAWMPLPEPYKAESEG